MGRTDVSGRVCQACEDGFQPTEVKPLIITKVHHQTLTSMQTNVHTHSQATHAQLHTRMTAHGHKHTSVVQV